MKLLHTSDWHVGKHIRGNSRIDEHRAVLSEIAVIAESEQVDIVLVAGDLFDTAAPPPEAEQVVFDALLRLASSGATVAVISGNHDNARRLGAVAPLLERCGIHVVSEPLRPADGGVRSFTSRDGTPVKLAMLPFVSQRGIVRAEQLMAAAAFEHAQLYSQRLHLLIDMLSREFTADTANVLMAHAFVVGGVTGGGERAAHLADEYSVPSPSFPASAGYVALGHLHRAQSIGGATAIHYCGSPLQLDFSDNELVKQVNIVSLTPGLPAKVTPRPLETGRPLRSYAGTIDELRDVVRNDDAWLRLTVREAHRAGLGDDVRAMFGSRVVEVLIEPPGGRTTQQRPPRRQGRSPQELFAEFMAEQHVNDGRVGELFAELLDAESEQSA